MCYYRLYIFLGCGHSACSSRPVRPCAAARAAPSQEADGRQVAQGEAQTKTLPDAHTADTAAPSTFHAAADGRDVTPNTDTNGILSKPSSSPSPSPRHVLALCTTALTHPFQTFNIHTSCGFCARQRAALLSQIESQKSSRTVRFEDWRWKVKYLSPTPEEARYSAEWTNVGDVMGSWVRELKGRGNEILAGLREQGEGDRGVWKGKAKARERERKDSKDLGRMGYRDGLGSS